MRPLRSSFARPPASTGGVWTFIAGGSAGRQSGAQKMALRSGPAPPPWTLVRARRHTIPTRLPQATPSRPPAPEVVHGRMPAAVRPRLLRRGPGRAATDRGVRPLGAVAEGPATGTSARRSRPTRGAECRSGRPHPGTGRFDNLPREGDPCTERSEAETTAPPSARRRMISASRTGSARGRPSVRTSCAPSFAGRA